ncbi:MAG: hypothetical protein ONB48_04490 [candidate division KSB1 bacterium]|nr:hypothetical protein [candidate division KSB1 bacterium]MDZ7274431.1 hypothetical protein [candidate division KSB1 bacterium]MDZ7284907.1 hypothetical protein [candidate division KSB1 bacterium]MDZ7297672.1 hypothetical protein [candidate division KSB1 bacterium]MDZ7305904.1 hypothetical protein [candidate division KSB1 bacterium]
MRSFFLLPVALLALLACQNGNPPRQPETETGGAISPREGAPSAPEARVPDEAAAQALLQLQEKVMQQPQEIAARRELGARAMDAAAGTLWTVGRGRIPPGENLAAVAQSKARQAALLDASRWAAYLLEWQKNDYATAFGSLQGTVPNGTIVRESITDSLCTVLVKTTLPR